MSRCVRGGNKIDPSICVRGGRYKWTRPVRQGEEGENGSARLRQGKKEINPSGRESTEEKRGTSHESKPLVGSRDLWRQQVTNFRKFKSG